MNTVLYTGGQVNNLCFLKNPATSNQRKNSIKCFLRRK